MHGFLIDRLDQQLAAAGDRFSLSLEHPNDHDPDNAAHFGTVEGQAAGTLGARVLNGSVTAAEVGRASPRRAARGQRGRPADARRAARSSDRAPVGFRDLGDYRVLVSAGADGDVLITGLPEHPVDDDDRPLAAHRGHVFAVALIVAGPSAR